MTRGDPAYALESILKWRAKAAVNFLAVNLVLGATYLFIAVAGRDVPPPLARIGSLVLLGGVIYFSLWFHGAYRFFALFGPVRARWSTARAVGVFFFPPVNLWMGCLIVAEVWRGCGSTERERRKPISGLVFCWWLACIVAAPLELTRYLSAMAPSPPSPVSPQPMAAVVLPLFGDSFTMLAAALGIIVVRRLTNKLLDLVGSGEPVRLRSRRWTGTDWW